METIISLRAFPVTDPSNIETWVMLGETNQGEWNYQHDPAPNPFSSAFEQYVADEMGDIDTVQPAPQRV
jgi:hypothetical protein